MTQDTFSALPFAEIQVGDTLPPFERTPDKAQLIRYAGAEDDYFPVHWDQEFATRAGFPEVINHGWLTYALLLQAVTQWIPPQEASIVSTDCRYVRPTFPGEAIICSALVTGKTDDAETRSISIQVEATNPAGEVTTRASMTLEYP